jgi:ribosomal protein S18 acetylase RimI-like enzyme
MVNVVDERAGATTDPVAVALRPMELSDVGKAVELHVSQLPPGFFVQLGPRFLAAYYRSYLTSPAAISLIAVIDGVNAGFLVGTIDRNAHYRHVARHGRYRLAAVGAVALVSDPAMLVRFVKTRSARYARGLLRFASQQPDSSQASDAAVLSHVAIDPRYRRRSAASALVGSFEAIAASSGARAAHVLTRRDNDPARRLYEARGWVVSGEQIDVDGHHWCSMEKVLVPARAPQP